jgi:S-layer protein (TIGR01567 family)
VLEYLVALLPRAAFPQLHHVDEPADLLPLPGARHLHAGQVGKLLGIPSRDLASRRQDLVEARELGEPERAVDVGETVVVAQPSMLETDYSDVRNLKIGDKIGEFTLEEIISGENISNQGSLVFKNATGSSISCNVVGTNYKCDSWSNQYPSINLFGEKYFPLLANSDQSRKPYNDPIWECHVDKLAKLVLDSDEKHFLKTDEKLDLGQGYSLQVKQIDVDGDRALIEFDKDGKYVDDTIVLTYPNEHYWTCLRDNIQGEDNIPVLKVYVSKVYQDGSDSIVQIDGIWLIDYANARTLKIGDKMGESTLEKIVSGTNSSNLGSLAFKKTQAVDSSHTSEEKPVVSTNKSTSPSISWHLDLWKFLTGKSLETEEPNSTTTTSDSTV